MTLSTSDLVKIMRMEDDVSHQDDVFIEPEESREEEEDMAVDLSPVNRLLKFIHIHHLK